MRRKTTASPVRFRRGVTVLFAFSLTAAACGSGGEAGQSSESTSAATSPDSGSAVDASVPASNDSVPTSETVAGATSTGALGEFEAKVAETWGTATGPVDGFDHASGPAIASGKSIGAACLGSQITACVQWWDQVEAVGKQVGWDVAIYDGQIDVAVWNEQLTRMAQAGHDGLLVFGGIPSLSTEGLTAIEASGLPLIGMTSDDPDGVAALAARLDGGIEKDNFEVGYLQGVAAYTLGKGKVHAIGGYDGSEISVAREAGFQAFVDECTAAGGDCWAKLRPTDTGEMFTQIETFCPSLAQANPDFNVMISQVDDITAICIDAIDAAGLLKDGDFGIGVDYNSIAIDRIANSDSFGASIAIPYSSGAWQGIDELNRIISGEEPLDHENRPWPKRIFFDDNDDAIDQSNDQPWDVQLFDPESFYGPIWGAS
jgi:ribose transport system substrate-binding protein